MIEGLKMDVSAAELGDHLLNRAEEHAKKAGLYAKEIGAIEKAEEEDEDADKETWHNVSNDPKAGLRQRMKDHRRKAAMFRFMRDHLVKDEVYRLSESDLVRLELIS